MDLSAEELAFLTSVEEVEEECNGVEEGTDLSTTLQFHRLHSHSTTLYRWREVVDSLWRNRQIRVSGGVGELVEMLCRKV